MDNICQLDTTMERNTLMAKCYPRIKDYCREKHGLEFQVCLIIFITVNLERVVLKGSYIT